MNEKEIINKLNQIESLIENLQLLYNISGGDKFEVIDLLDEIKDLIN